MSECNGQDVVTFAMMSVKHSVMHRLQIGKLLKTQTQKEKSQENCNRDCSIVRGQQLGRKMDQRPLRDGKKYKDKIG